MRIRIERERPDTEAARRLIEELDAYLATRYPIESRHGYSVEQLLREEVAFFLSRAEGEPAGCAGIRLFGSDYGEVKRLYVRPAYRGRGLAKRLLEALESHARSHGVTLIRLETGIHQTESIGLYERTGYSPIGPFGEYRDDPLSLFYEKRLE